MAGSKDAFVRAYSPHFSSSQPIYSLDELLNKRIISTFSRLLVGDSNAMRQVKELTAKFALTGDDTVLLYGESGVGKEQVARAIKEIAYPHDKPFIAINCAALPPTLLESELFGHEKGAFTGAHERRIGKFEEAKGGVIFLDEIGEAPPEIQQKLLRVVERKTIERLGGNTTIPVKVKIIAATNKNVFELSRGSTSTREASFRLDLFNRLNRLPIYIPPLRQRPDDIMTVANFLLEKENEAKNKKIKGFSPEAEAKLKGHYWPGNIRELGNVIARGVVFAQGDIIQPDDIKFDYQIFSQGVDTAHPTIQIDFRGTLKEVLDRARLAYLDYLSQLHQGNVSAIAEAADMKPSKVRQLLGL